MTAHPPSYRPPYPPPGHGYDPADLSRPLYGADVGQAFVRFWKKYVVFSGRASRSELWWWILLSVGISAVLNSVNYTMAVSYLPSLSPQLDLGQYARDTLTYTVRANAGSLVWLLATVVGLLALSARRLHDTDRSGWWCLIGLVPLVGWIILVVFWTEGPKAGGQRYDR